jgi:hypothetical protein
MLSKLFSEIFIFYKTLQLEVEFSAIYWHCKIFSLRKARWGKNKKEFSFMIFFDWKVQGKSLPIISLTTKIFSMSIKLFVLLGYLNLRNSDGIGILPV